MARTLLLMLPGSPDPVAPQDGNRWEIEHVSSGLVEKVPSSWLRFDWCVVSAPGESWKRGSVTDFAAALHGRPAKDLAVRVPRFETSPSGRRGTHPVRAFRPGAVSGPARLDIGEVPVASGRTSDAPPGLELAFDRAAQRNAWGAAEAAERDGDFLRAAAIWEAARADYSSDPDVAYTMLRQALALAAVHFHACAVRNLLGTALARCPTMPEAALRLGEYYERSGDLVRALVCVSMAAAVFPSAPVPQLEGPGTWRVPWQAARWTARSNPEASCNHAETALRASPPPSVTRELMQLVVQSGVQLPENEYYSPRGGEQWPT